MNASIHQTGHQTGHELRPLLDIVVELTAIGQALVAFQYINAERLYDLAVALSNRLGGRDPGHSSDMSISEIGPLGRHEAARLRAWNAARTLASILGDTVYQFSIGNRSVRPALVRAIDQIDSLFADIVWLEQSTDDAGSATDLRIPITSRRI